MGWMEMEGVVLRPVRRGPVRPCVTAGHPAFRQMSAL